MLRRTGPDVRSDGRRQGGMLIVAARSVRRLWLRLSAGYPQSWLIASRVSSRSWLFHVERCRRRAPASRGAQFFARCVVVGGSWSWLPVPRETSLLSWASCSRRNWGQSAMRADMHGNEDAAATPGEWAGRPPAPRPPTWLEHCTEAPAGRARTRTWQPKPPASFRPAGRCCMLGRRVAARAGSGCRGVWRWGSVTVGHERALRPSAAHASAVG